MKIILTISDNAVAMAEATRLKATYGEGAVTVLSPEPDEPVPTVDELWRKGDPLAAMAVIAWYVIRYGRYDGTGMHRVLPGTLSGKVRVPSRRLSVPTTAGGCPSIDLSLGFPAVTATQGPDTDGTVRIDNDPEVFEQIKKYVGAVLQEDDADVFRMTFDELRSWFISPLRRRVEALDISLRVKNSLLSMGITTVEDLITYDRKTLLRFSGMGEKAVSYIEAALKEVGFSLREA